MSEWSVQVNKDNPTYPFIVIDNYYNPEEEKAIWKELDFFTANSLMAMDRAEDTIVARDEDGNSKSKAYRVYVDDYYIHRKVSPILKFTNKLLTKEFSSLMKQCEPYSRSFFSSNFDSTLVSYYEEDDHYKPHHDTFLWTCLIWFYKEPKLFDGGDFFLNDIDYEIKLKHNRMVMFPSCFLHSVTPIKFHTNPNEPGYGRWTITTFYSSGPSEIPNENK